MCCTVGGDLIAWHSAAEHSTCRTHQLSLFRAHTSHNNHTLFSHLLSQAHEKPLVVEPALQKLRSFLTQIDEDPNVDLDGPIKKLRQVRGLTGANR